MRSITLASDGLHIDGKPFPIIGAELHNSSSSTDELIRHSFRRAADVGANTVLAPVSWDQLEPVEGEFDFSLVDVMLRVARENGLRLIPLWFGSWKNATSSYVPAWVKTDPTRFPRASTSSTGAIEQVSPFSPESRQADARAFAALMQHLHRIDTEGTVIMVQVENEVGILGDSRDRSVLADEAWSSIVPDELVAAIAKAEGSPGHRAWVAAGRREAGTWGEIFGDTSAAHEVFMAWAYASYVEVVAAAGRAQHDVPLYANAWLDSELDADASAELPGPALAGGMQPGTYPSGGPVLRVAAVWRAAAPTIDLLAPDIYFGDIDRLCSGFLAASGHLFIPEMRRSALGVAHMFVAVGQYRAIGISPFGVDSLEPGSTEEAVLVDGLRLVGAAATALRNAPSSASRGFILDAKCKSWSGSFGEYTVEAQLRPDAELGYGIVMEERPGIFLVLGREFHTRFIGNDAKRAGILSATQLDFDGEWHVVQHMNGDETLSGSGVRMHGLEGEAFYRFPIPTITHSTGIVRVELYSYR